MNVRVYCFLNSKYPLNPLNFKKYIYISAFFLFLKLQLYPYVFLFVFVHLLMKFPGPNKLAQSLGICMKLAQACLIPTLGNPAKTYESLGKGRARGGQMWGIAL